MDNNSNIEQYIVIRPLGERVATLETKLELITTELTEIKEKLDELLTLKHKGLGALGLVSVLVGSGVIGLIAIVLNFFGRH